MSVRVGAGLPAAVVSDGSPNLFVVWDNGAHRIVLTGTPEALLHRLRSIVADIETVSRDLASVSHTDEGA